MTLGTNNATFTGLGIKLDGPLAYVARRLAYLVDANFRSAQSWF